MPCFFASSSATAPTRRSLAVLYGVLAALYFGPHFSQAIAKLTGLQCFPLLLLLAAIWQARQLWPLDLTQYVGERGLQSSRPHLDRPRWRLTLRRGARNLATRGMVIRQ